MKRIYQFLLVAVAVIGINTSCSDVPAPYEVNPGTNGGGKTLPYKSTALNTGWTMHCISANEPWSQGSSYIQATGYQDWEGTGSKSNVEVESYLISPAFNTACESGKVRFYFDNTIRYTNNVSGWHDYEKIFVSSNYDGKNFDAASWEQIAWTPTASPFSDWTLYTSGQIQLPEAYVNKDSVYIAFYFYAPGNASTTWELENFIIEEGEADNSSNVPTPIEGSGSGTATDPYNVAAAISFTSALAADTNSDPVYITGIICSDPNIDTGQFGNATFYISDDGTENNRFYVFRTMDLGNQKFTDANKLKKGDRVVIYGPLVNYRGNTPETVGSKTYLISINGEGGNTPAPTPIEGSGSGTATDPYNVAAAISFTSALAADTNSDPVYITGIICSDPNIDTGQYGNATFYISDDGSNNNRFYVFRTMDLGNQKFTDANKLKKGDRVVIYGPLVNYRGNTPETVGSKTYLISINGEGGNTPAPTPIEGSGSGTATDPYNAAAAISFASALAADVNSDPVYITGIICSDPNIDTGQFGNATFYISDDGTENNRFYVFRTMDLGNQKFTDANKLKKGDRVVIYGPLVNYRGNTPETVGSKTYLISINGSSEGGGDTPDTPDNPDTSEGVSISETTVTLTNPGVTAGNESIKIDFSTLGLDNAAEMGTVTLSDGTTIVFDKGSNSNAPKYYTATKGARVYANNTITFNGKSKIARVVMTCDSYNSVDYVGNATATISVSGNTLVYTNASPNAGTQLRVQTVTITYAE